MIDNRLRLERQIYLGRQAVNHAQQSLSGRGSREPLPPTSTGHHSTISAMRSLAEESDDFDDFDTQTLDAPEGWTAPAQSAEPRPSPSNNASFLSRLRTQSFPGFSSPIRRKGKFFMREGKAEGQPETSTSSDSSSVEDQPQRPAYHPTALRNRTDVRQIFTARRGGADDGSDGDQEDEEL
jgi:hypothetical protein